MFKKTDPYTLKQFCTLYNGIDSKGDPIEIGNICTEYQVTSYDDVQAQNYNSVIKGKNRKFLLHCTQRINIYNPSGMAPFIDPNFSSYNNYPAMINTLMSLNQSEGLDFQLLDYSPQTVNTKVQSSGSFGSSTGQTSGTNSSSTVGSTTSETNSYGASVTIGESPSTSANYEHSSTFTSETSQTKGREMSNSKGVDSSNSATMSIKDWGAYGMVNPSTKSPSWTFGQEYPWDAIECQKITTILNPNNSNQVQLHIPIAMLARLYDGESLYPPSQLSRFGINFVMKAFWLVTIDNGSTDEVKLEHSINYYSGSHLLDTTKNPNVPSVYIDKQPSQIYFNSDSSFVTTINLSIMALDTIGLQNSASIIGFVPNKFITQPVAASSSALPVPFKIISTSNDLLIEDTTKYPSTCDVGFGFSYSERALQANFTKNCIKLQMTIFFKVIDSVNDYTIFIKHWKTGDTGIILNLVINGNVSNPICKYVDAIEAEGGEKNLLSIGLRNQDYASIDYHDYLQLGLNSIEITIQPIGDITSDCGYQIRAISIEKE